MPPRPRPPALLIAAIAAAATVVVAAVAWSRPAVPLLPTAIPPLPSGDVEVILAAGDIAECSDDDDERTAALVEQMPGTVVVLGDNVYPDGSDRDHRECYTPSWGRFRERTRPIPGNHEYETAGARGYLDYWGERATPAGTTWYAWEAGEWRVLMLDSDCDAVGGCGPDAPQTAWLREELDASDARCTLAAWHHPRFSSGRHGGDARFDAWWELLHEAGAEIVLGAHDHNYERFAPQRPDATRDDERGIRQFVVGTGGSHLRDLRATVVNSEARDARTFGVLRLALLDSSYQWDFVPIGGGMFTDSGTGSCR